MHYVANLDIYLNPGWQNGTGFMYAASIYMLEATGFPACYFAVPVEVQNGTVLVAGYPVSDAGWYTFRFIYGEEDGALTVAFELAQNGRTLFTQSFPNTAGLVLPSVPTASLDADGVVPGYVWFVYISAGPLPVDHFYYRPGTK